MIPNPQRNPVITRLVLFEGYIFLYWRNQSINIIITKVKLKLIGILRLKNNDTIPKIYPINKPVHLVHIGNW